MSGLALVAIDGGKSAIRVRITDGTDTELWRGEGRGFHYSPDTSIAQAVLAAVTQALSTVEASTSPWEGAEVRVCAALTGMPGERAERRRLAAGLADLFGAEPLITDDVVAAHAGALAAPGTVVSAGTGTSVLAVGLDGTAARVDGWGPLIGDRGSAHDIGRAALRAAAAAHDHTGPMTSLSDRVFDTLGGTDLAALQRFYQSDDLTARVASLAHIVVQEADAGDDISAGICDLAAEDLAASALAAASISFHDPIGTAVSWSGRLLTAGSSLSTAFIRQLERYEMQVQAPLTDALGGATRLLTDDIADLYSVAVRTSGVRAC